MCSLPANRPLNNLKYTQHLTEMRRRWLTDTSISPAMCLTERGEQLLVPHAWRREHCLLVRGDTKRRGWGGRSRRLNFSSTKDTASPHWRAEIHVTLAYGWNVPEMACTRNSFTQWAGDQSRSDQIIYLIILYGGMQIQCYVGNSLFLWLA